MAAIAPWFRLQLPSCGPGFESQALHQNFFQFVIDLLCEKDEKKRKRGRDWPIFEKSPALLVLQRERGSIGADVCWIKV